MAERRPTSHGIVTYSTRADEDFSAIHANTAAVWGFEQAERYAELLEATAADLAYGTKKGKLIQGGHPKARAYFVKWHKAKHGHYIIYLAGDKEGEIFVTRILHGRMDIPKHI